MCCSGSTAVQVRRLAKHCGPFASHLLLRLLHILVIAFGSVGTAAAAERASLEQGASPNSLLVVRGGNRLAVALDVHIAGWHVSCDRRHAIVWGQTTKTLGLGEPPFATVYVVDMANAVARESFTTTRGPFEIAIDQSGALGIVDEHVIELPTGRVRLTEIPHDASFRPESCGASCESPATIQALMEPSGPVVLRASSCRTGEGKFDVTLELLVGGVVTQMEHAAAEGTAYEPSIDLSLDIDGDGVPDVGVVNGAGRAGDGMAYWLVKGRSRRLVRAGEAPRLSLSTDGKRTLYALIPGSGEVQATRVEYRVNDEQLQRVRSLQFVPIDALRTEVREWNHVAPAGSAPGKEQGVQLIGSDAAQRCMDGGPCS